MDIAMAHTKLREAKLLLERIEAAVRDAERNAVLPKEPERAANRPRVITFQKRFGRYSGRFYTYTALSPGLMDQWWISGRQLGDPTTGMTWSRLMEFLAKDETDTSLPQVIKSFRVWKPKKNHSL